jgi:U3 small nucleolar ribonucleoprotein component
MKLREVEEKRTEEKDWKHRGEVDSLSRPKDSLLNMEDIRFDQNKPVIVLSKKDENEIDGMVRKRMGEKAFDNWVVEEKKDEVFDADEECDIGCDGDVEMSKSEMEDLFKIISNKLMAISNCGGLPGMTEGNTLGMGGFGTINGKIFDEKKISKKKKTDKTLKILEKSKNVKIME